MSKEENKEGVVMLNINFKSFLESIPRTGRDVIPTDNVISLRDPDAPPGGLNTTWREIRAQRRVVDDLRDRKADMEHRLEAALQSMQQQMQDTAEKGEQLIARAQRDLAAETKKLAEAEERWIMMTRELGIDLQETPT